MTGSVTLKGVHSVVIDESQADSKALAVLVYDAGGNQLFNLVMATDSRSSVVSMKRPPPPPPPPPTVQVNGTSNPVAVVGGAAITATIAKGPGNRGDWLGVYAVGSPSGPGDPASWKWLSTDGVGGLPAAGVKSGTVHLVVPTVAGQYEVRFFSNSNFTVVAKSAAITASGAAAAAVQQVTLTPGSVSVPDNSPAGAPLSTIAVAMSDGSAFSGSLSISANNMVSISGAKAVLARAMTAADDGTHSSTITATQGATSKTVTLALMVVVAPPRTLVLSLDPPSPQIPDVSPSGTVIATLTAKYSDGTTPASVSLTSSDPTLFAIKGMQLVLARAMTAADDGTHTVTITASDGLGAVATARIGKRALT